MIIDFLVKRTVVFICEKCGDTISLYVPSSGESNIKSYCCSATYEVADRQGDILIERLADRDRDDDKRAYDDGMGMMVPSMPREVSKR